MMDQDQDWASGRGSDDAVGPRREFIRRFAEGIEKLAGHTSRDRQKKTVKGITFPGFSTDEPSVSDSSIGASKGQYLLGCGKADSPPSHKGEEKKDSDKWTDLLPDINREREGEILPW
ncbi:hypothetical protein BHM03_00053899 [Ensete ventricosum]|nr:hypothetical protein BHM03_00053899 [Ensete ventricosum]